MKLEIKTEKAYFCFVGTRDELVWLLTQAGVEKIRDRVMEIAGDKSA